MRWTALLALTFLVAPAADAAVRLSVAPGALPPAAVAATAAAAEHLLRGPARRDGAAGLVYDSPSWKAAPGAERERGLAVLRSLWGPRLTVSEDAAPAAAKALPKADASLARHAALRERVDSAPRPLDAGAQSRFYDGAPASRGGSAVVSADASAPAADAPAASRRLRPAAPPPAPVPAPREKPRWGRAGWEALKGAGQAVADVFTWKGLAVAACSVALVTVAPITLYGLLVLGAGLSAYSVGKALRQGYLAHRAGDAEGVYAASREFGRGTLGLTLSFLGARHPPTNLRPHFPSTAGEWRAMAAAMDDEPVVAVSLLRGRSEP